MSPTAETPLVLKKRPVSKLPIPEKYEGKLPFPSTDKQLTRMQSLFVEYYLQGKRPTEAARMAGYKESTCLVAGSMLLRTPVIYKAINSRARDKFKELEVNTDFLLGQLGAVATANILDYGTVDEQGKFEVDLRNIDRMQGLAIQEITYDATGRQKIRLEDKNAARNTIIKLLGLDQEKPNLGDKQPLTIQSLDTIVGNVTINQTVNQINIQPRERQVLPEMNTIEASV